MAVDSSFSGRLFFAPKALESRTSLPGSTPLTVGQFLVIDPGREQIEVIQVLDRGDGRQHLSQLQPGNYTVRVDVRAKSGKQGQNYWFISAESSGQKAAA